MRLPLLSSLASPRQLPGLRAPAQPQVLPGLLQHWPGPGGAVQGGSQGVHLLPPDGYSLSLAGLSLAHANG